MSKCKILINLSFVFLIFNHGFSADYRGDLIEKSLDLNRQGFDYISPLLEPEEIEQIYSKDEEFIKSFPFEEYKLVDVQKQGCFFIDEIFDTIKNVLITGNPWELSNKNIIDYYVKRGTIALDIGSHIGTHTITMSKKVGNLGKVFAFEPNKKIYRELCLNIAANKRKNITPLRCAIGKNKDIIEMVISHEQNEGGTYAKPGLTSNSAIMLDLDSFDLNNISFIKIDVENLEGDVLLGAKETISRCRPIMLVEIQGNGERPLQMGEDSKAMGKKNIELLLKMGYKLQYVGGADYLAFPVN